MCVCVSMCVCAWTCMGAFLFSVVPVFPSASFSVCTKPMLLEEEESLGRTPVTVDHFQLAKYWISSFLLTPNANDTPVNKAHNLVNFHVSKLRDIFCYIEKSPYFYFNPDLWDPLSVIYQVCDVTAFLRGTRYPLAAILINYSRTQTEFFLFSQFHLFLKYRHFPSYIVSSCSTKTWNANLTKHDYISTSGPQTTS